jgi:hypothetical protein
MMIVVRKFWDQKQGAPNQKLEIKDFINEFTQNMNNYYSSKKEATHQVNMSFNYYLDLCTTGLYMLISGPIDKKKFYAM